MAHRVAVVTIVDVLGYDVEKHLHLAALVMNRGPTMIMILAVSLRGSAHLGKEEVAHLIAADRRSVVPTLQARRQNGHSDLPQASGRGLLYPGVG